MRLVRMPSNARYAALALCVFSITGCTQQPASSSSGQATSPENPQPASAVVAAENPASKSPADLSASEILQQLLATYRQAKTYQDQGVVRLAFRQNAQSMSEELPAAVAFERPAKLSIRAYQATVKSDGRELRARIEDPLTGNVDNQVVVRSAPAAIKLSDLASDALLYDILSSRLRRQPIQLELLLESTGLVSAFNADVACRRLTDETHAGQKCFRVEVPSPGGAFIFWVDSAHGLLRRLDYPAAALVPDLASDASVSELSLLADLRGAKLNEPIPAAQFSLDLPPNARQMKSFAIPPRPLPSELFGQQPSEFFFTRLGGDKLADSDLKGNITVLAWYHDNPACEATLQQVAAASKRLTGDQKAAFYAVATDPTASTDDALQKRLAAWNVDLPIVRDLEAFGDKAFHIEVQPTIVVLDKRLCVQIFQAGGSPELANQLVAIVERLSRGEDLAQGIIQQHAQEKREYEQLLARGGAEPGELIELPEAVIRQRSEPKKIQLAPLWTCSEVKTPGNVLVVPAAAGPRIFVLEGWRGIAELDSTGRVVKRYAPEIPQPAAITFLRTAMDKDGKRLFAAGSPLSPQVFIFDENWKLKLAFPPPGQAPLQVMDLAFAPLAADDASPDLLIAGAGGVGLVCLSLDGEVRWRNSAFPSALSVATTQPDDFGARSLYVAGESGALLKVNRFGHEDPPITIPNWPVGRLLGAPFKAANQASFLALSTNDKGQPFAVGLASDLKERWNYPLPPGVHQKPIEPIAHSRVLPGHDGEWWLAGPDGSIHVITADGQLFDSFHYGAPLTGLAACNLNNKPTLLISTDQTLTAWSLTIPLTRTPVER